MIKYKDKLKKIDTNKTVWTGTIDDNWIETEVVCQYNPDRFKYWEMLYKKGFARSEMLKVKHSPHHSFIYWNKRKYKPIHETMYYKMHELYGRTDGWIINKILKFQDLIKDVRENGVKEPIILTSRPIVRNEYNINKLEIFEGHHRLSICYYFHIPCRIIVKDVPW